ncbi:unnamed protein product, partial [marine sediment metagenome]
MLDKLKFRNKIEIKDYPTAWLPSLQLYDPYLPQFPIIYIHKVIDGKRVYGAPVYFNITDIDKDKGSLEFCFLSNVDLSLDSKLRQTIQEELEERIGLKDKVDLETLQKACQGNAKFEAFIKEIWK